MKNRNWIKSFKKNLDTLLLWSRESKEPFDSTASHILDEYKKDLVSLLLQAGETTTKKSSKQNMTVEEYGGSHGGSWHSKGVPKCIGTPLDQDEDVAGNPVPAAPRDDPGDIFIEIWDQQIMEHIVSETNFRQCTL